MVGKAHRDLSELSYHIVKLCSFWKHSPLPPHEDNAVRVLASMIKISLGIDDANRIARAVVLELESIRLEKTDDEVNPDDIEVVFISAFLNEQIDELAVPTTTAYWSLIFESPI